MQLNLSVLKNMLGFAVLSSVIGFCVAFIWSRFGLAALGFSIMAFSFICVFIIEIRQRNAIKSPTKHHRNANIEEVL